MSEWVRIPFEEVAPSRLGKMLDGKRQTGQHARPYLRNENVQWGRFDLTDVSTMDFDESDREEFLLRPGDLIICEGGEPGRCAIWRGELKECYFQKALHRARPIASKATPDYLSYLFRWLAGSGGLKDHVTSSTIAHLTGEKLKQLPIPVPRLAEQRRIAARLEQADRLRRTRRYALELSDTFLPAAFLELFGDRFHKGPFLRFEDLVTITGGGTPSRDRPEFYNGRIPWLTSKDMRGDYIWDTEEHITQDALENSSTKLIPANSILVVVKSKVLMHRLPVALAKVPMCHGQDIKSIQCSEEFHHEFARFVLKHHESRLLNIARGANTEGLTLPMLHDLPVPKVDLTEQQKFAALVERVERLRAVQRESLRQAEHLFASLLAQEFKLESPLESRLQAALVGVPASAGSLRTQRPPR